MATGTLTQESPIEEWEVAEEDEEALAPKKIGGMVWWLLLGMFVFFDLMSILLNILIAVGTGLSATVVGAVVGIPLAILAEGGDIFLIFTALLISNTFFWLNGVSLLGVKKLVTMFMSVIIEFIPIVSILPSASISFILITMFENSERKGGVLSALARKVSE